MTIDQFQSKFKIKNKRTVFDWIHRGLIPGVSMNAKGQFVIPKDALPPYTRARARAGAGMYLSLLKGICSNRQVLPQLYEISESLFNEYICVLKKSGFIKIRTVNGVEYYTPTMKAEQYIRENTGIPRLVKVLSPWIKATASGYIDGLKN